MSYEENDIDLLNSVVDEDTKLLNLAIKASLDNIDNPDNLDNIDNIDNLDNTNYEEEDDQIKKAIEESLIINQKQNEELFNSVLYQSLDTLEDNEKILEKVIEESHLSNISVRVEHETLNNSISNIVDNENENGFINQNSLDNDDEEYMKMIIQQIKESEELEETENKLKKNKEFKNIVEEQNRQYEEALLKDIEKEKDKDKEIINDISSKTIINDEPVLPKTKEELRKLRLAFYDKK